MQRRRLKRTYMGFLLLLTVAVLFVSTWLALYLSKMVTRPLVALAEATHEISRGTARLPGGRAGGQRNRQAGGIVQPHGCRPGGQPRQHRSVGPRAGRHECATGAAHPAQRNHSGECSVGRAFARCLPPRTSFQPGGAPPAAPRRGPASSGRDACATCFPRTWSPTSSTCCARPTAWAARPARWRSSPRAPT